MMAEEPSSDYSECAVPSDLSVRRVLVVIQQGHYPVIPTITQMENSKLVDINNL